MLYKHTQSGWVIIFSVGNTSLILLLLAFFLQMSIIGWIAIFLLVLTLFIFGSLTIEVTSEKLKWYFGIGLVRKSIFLQEIQTVSIIKNSWYYGWGIRLTPHGWLYNVSGTRGVEIELKSGKKFRLGSDEPEKLAQVIDNGIR
ncbi:hypothetical protein JW964_00165 [candidate division KSB1 bacterium]|nr:hypothetical protein [candidate division KSB1 bacterium]